MAGGGSLRLTGLDCPKISFLAAILVLMRHTSVDIPVSCPRLLGFFFFPQSYICIAPQSLSYMTWFFCAGSCVALGPRWSSSSVSSSFMRACKPVQHQKKNKKNIQRYSESNSSGGLTEHIIWEGSMYTVWLRTRVCFTWKFPPCECTNNPTRLVNLADYQLTNELMMEILYKWGTMLRSVVSTFKN